MSQWVRRILRALARGDSDAVRAIRRELADAGRLSAHRRLVDSIGQAVADAQKRGLSDDSAAEIAEDIEGMRAELAARATGRGQKRETDETARETLRRLLAALVQGVYG